MATVVLKYQKGGSSPSTNFKKNARVRVTYTTNGGSITVTKVEGCRTDGYTSYGESGSNRYKITFGSSTSDAIYSRNIYFRKNSDYYAWTTPSTTLAGAGTQNISIYIEYCNNAQINGTTWGGETVSGGTPASPTYSRSVSNITRTSARLNVSCTSNPSNYWRIHWYDVNAQWAGYSGNGATGSWYYDQSGLTPNTSYNFYTQVTNNSDGEGTGLSPIGFTTSGNAPTASSLNVSNVTRTSASLSISASYDTNAWNSSSTYQYGTSTSYGSSTGASMIGLTPNTTYYVRGYVTDNWSRDSGWVSNSFKTTGNNPSITSHGVQTYGQTTMTMKYSASYDINDSFSSYKWDVGTSTSYGKTFNNTNSLTGLTANTTYYYRLTVTSSQGRSSTATGSFKTDYATQQVTSIVAEDITETSISGIVNVPNPTWLTNLTIWIYSGDTLINTITKTSGISASNSFLFEDLSPGTSYEIRARITTQTQNSSGAYNSNIKTLAVTTVDASPVHVIKSDGTDKKYKMYVMGKGNIYNPNVLTWQNGYYANGSIGQSISDVLTQSTEVNGGAASTNSFIEILPNIQYTITNNDIDVDFIIHGTDSSNKITTVGYTISPGQSYAYTGTPSTNRLWISIKSNTNPVINYATAKFFKLNIFRTIEKTLIPKDNIVYINGKIRYIDIVQAGSNHETDGADSRIVALKVYNSAGNDIALNKTVTMIKGKNPANLQRITDGDITSTDYASISGKTSNDLETIVRVDLGKDYTDIDHVTLWRYYQDGRTYLNTKLYGRDATTRLTWKFHDFRIQGEYAETSTGYSSSISHEIIEGVPVIISILQEPNNNTNTIVGTKLTINAEWLTSIPPVLNSWISYRTDAILAANQGRLLKNEIGNLSELSTTAKDSLVEAINEVWSNYLGSDEYTNVLNAVLNAILNR